MKWVQAVFPVLCLVAPAHAQSDPTVALLPKLPPTAGSSVDFARDIEPIFADHCHACHGPAKQRGGLRLDERGRALEGGPKGFTVWLAGGGIKAGTLYGATDEFGYEAVENRVSIPDLHATCLHLLDLNHFRLTFRHSGRDMRLTDVSGEIIRASSPDDPASHSAGQKRDG